ncbi:NUDIX hydrolase domain-like protein [Syncephalis fuscata]|nr:NUDIX hydrolase domain-like protein [Syncephalis fuscata]
MSQLTVTKTATIPTIVVGIVVLAYRSVNSDQVIVGLRKGKHGGGSWQFPGGGLEFGESFEECAQRECHEETGLEIDDVRVITCFNVLFKEANKHCVAVFVRGVCKNPTAEPQNMEPEKNDGWHWTTMAELRAMIRQCGDPDGLQLIYTD